jgi:hypothetical protein
MAKKLAYSGRPSLAKSIGREVHEEGAGPFEEVVSCHSDGVTRRNDGILKEEEVESGDLIWKIGYKMPLNAVQHLCVSLTGSHNQRDSLSSDRSPRLAAYH